MKKVTLLIVEDEAVVAADLANRLRHLGYTVVGSVAQGEEGVALAHRLRPDLVLMDIHLAGAMDGVEAAERIRRECDVPVIYLTAHSDRATLARAKVTEPFGYILKPFDEHSLPTHIEMAVYRHQAEQKLRASEERFRLLAENTDQVFWFMELHPERLLYVSPAFAQTWGLPTSALQENPGLWAERIHPDDRLRVTEARRRWANGDGAEYNVEYRIIRPDGGIRWIDDRGTVTAAAAGRPKRISGIARDITAPTLAREREMTAMAALTAAQTARDTIDAMREGVLLLDLSAIISLANPAVEQLTGYPRQELIGRSLAAVLPELLAPAELALALQDLEQVLRGETVAMHPLTIHARDGRQFVVAPAAACMRDRDGTPTSIALTWRDVSALKHVEDDLRASNVRLERSERQYRDLVENANSIIMRVTKAGVVTFFNEYAERFFGYRKEEIIGRNVVGTIVPEVESSGRRLDTLIRDVHAHPEAHASNENENACRDGRRVWVQWTNRALRDRKGRFTEILCVGNDATERKQAEVALEESRQRLSSVVSHAPVVLLAVNSTGLCTLVQGKGLNAFRLAPAALLGTRLTDAGATLPARFRASLRRALGGEEIATEVTVPTRRVLDMKFVPMLSPDGSVGGVVCVGVDVTERRRAEAARKRHQQRLRHLTTELVLAEERERRRLSSGLHDEVLQDLTLASIQLAGLQGTLPSHADAKLLQQIRTTFNRATERIRNVCVELSPPVLYDLAPEDALHWLCERIQDQHGIPVTFRRRGKSAALDEPRRILLFTGTRELLVNMVKHAEASAASLTISTGRRGMSVVLKDNGVGFDPQAIQADAAKHVSLGLFGVRERLHQVGGTLRLASAPGEGTTATIRMPLQGDRQRA